MPDEPRTRWTDDRIDDLATVVKAISPVAQTSAVHATQLDDVERDVSSMGKWIGDVETRLSHQIAEGNAALHRRIDTIREEMRADQAARRTARTQILVAIIGGAFLIAGVVLTALLTGGAG